MSYQVSSAAELGAKSITSDEITTWRSDHLYRQDLEGSQAWVKVYYYDPRMIRSDPVVSTLVKQCWRRDLQANTNIRDTPRLPLMQRLGKNSAYSTRITNGLLFITREIGRIIELDLGRTTARFYVEEPTLTTVTPSANEPTNFLKTTTLLNPQEQSFRSKLKLRSEAVVDESNAVLAAIQDEALPFPGPFPSKKIPTSISWSARRCSASSWLKGLIGVEGRGRNHATYIDLLYAHWWKWDTSVKEVMDRQSSRFSIWASRIHRPRPSRIRTSTPGVMARPPSLYTKANGTSYSGFFEWEFIPMARHLGMAIAPFGVLAGGKLRTVAEEQRRLELGEEGRKTLGD
ncbi:arylalcohol dehydrogenase [Moniliophthora roreri]|nr:arylalcohol dehydrogenase [Moniliophthora roreri]